MSKEYYEKNKEKISERKKKYRKENKELIHLQEIKSRSKRKGLEFDLEISDLVYPEYCPILNIRLEHNLNKTSWNSPSVDRIDPNKGYTKDNIWIISQLANAMKTSATPEQLITFAKWVLSTYA